MNYKINIFILFTIFTLKANAQQQVDGAIYKGNEAYRKGDLSKAKEQYSKALQGDTANDKANYNLGVALEKSRQHIEAAQQFSKVINHTSDTALKAKAYYNKGVSLLTQNKASEAINAFKNALRLNPADDDARENLQKAFNELKPKQKQPQPRQQKQLNQKELEEKLKQLRESENQLQKQRLQKSPVKQQPEKDW